MRRLLVCILPALLSGCHEGKPAETIVLATTTSTQDSGLLDHLIPMFHSKTGVGVKVVAVGSGQALQLGRRGDADALLVHAPLAEEQFMAEGYGAERLPVMYNDFVLVGPEDDPAHVREADSIVDAFSRVAETRSSFISRGDDSGTHQKERQIWERASVAPQEGWYVEAGVGMGHVLRIASEKQAYALADRGTFLALREGLDLVILGKGDPLLVNPYHLVLVSPEKHPHVRVQAARRFGRFLLSEDAQKIIAQFGTKEHGEPLFFAGSPDAEELP